MVCFRRYLVSLGLGEFESNIGGRESKIAVVKFFPKILLAILLLILSSASWAACPEGTKNDYKGKCVPIPGAVVTTSEGMFILPIIQVTLHKQLWVAGIKR